MAGIIVGSKDCEINEVILELSQSDSFHLFLEKLFSVSQRLGTSQTIISGLQSELIFKTITLDQAVDRLIRGWATRNGSKAKLTILNSVLTDVGLKGFAEKLEMKFKEVQHKPMPSDTSPMGESKLKIDSHSSPGMEACVTLVTPTPVKSVYGQSYAMGVKDIFNNTDEIGVRIQEEYPMYNAAAKGDLKAIKYLLDAGNYDVNELKTSSKYIALDESELRKPLDFALASSSQNTLEVIKLLMAKGATSSLSELNILMNNEYKPCNWLEIFQHLHKNGARFDFTKKFRWAILTPEEYDEFVEYLIEANDSVSLRRRPKNDHSHLYYAIYRFEPFACTLKALSKIGFHFQADPLINAAIFSSYGLPFLKKLIEYGADCTKTDSQTNSPLHGAAIIRNHEAINYLMKVEGVEVNGLNKNGQTPLLCLVDEQWSLSDYKFVMCFEEMLKGSVNVNKQDYQHGNTVLHYLMQGTHYSSTWEPFKKVVGLLLEKGADINLKNAIGISPLEYSIENIKDAGWKAKVVQILKAENQNNVCQYCNK